MMVRRKQRTFWVYTDNLNAFVEIVPSSKLENDAKARNSAFFTRVRVSMAGADMQVANHAGTNSNQICAKSLPTSFGHAIDTSSSLCLSKNPSAPARPGAS